MDSPRYPDAEEWKSLLTRAAQARWGEEAASRMQSLLERTAASIRAVMDYPLPGLEASSFVLPGPDGEER
ncbi:MAG TPA: hypothetical protein VNL15_04230 [Dehalococcoidia bacterium]|nr:hypothetical protein [Dehalococcoidia bacterium]